MANNQNNDSKCIFCLGKCYDILAQSISILDVATDVWVCVAFYNADRMVFFGISLSILILACMYNILLVIIVS